MFDKKTYISRRKRLAESVSKGIILILGNSEASCNYRDNTYLFRQDSSFLYFFGLDKPDLAAVIDVESGEEIVFGNDVDINDIIWMGPQLLISVQAVAVGVAKSAPCLSGKISGGSKAKDVNPLLATLPQSYKILLHKMLGIGFDNLKEAASVELTKAVVALREIKEECEIVEIEKACNLGYDMHMAAMKAMKLGKVEQELVGIMEGICASGGIMPSFPIILSQNGETLHNHSHHQILTEGRLCVIDAGAEVNSHYASDFTRTLPCSGKFTKQQAEIYSLVAAANNYAIGAARPGLSYTDVHLGAVTVLVQA